MNMNTNVNLILRPIINEDFYMEIPENFDIMPEEVARIKYPSDMRPDVIFTNENATVDYKFNYIKQTVEVELLDELIKQTKSNLRKIYTGVQYYEDGIMQLNSTKLGWFDFSSPAIGDTLYNIFFYTWIDENLLQGAFNCSYSDTVYWRPIILNSLRTIKRGVKNE